METKELLQIKVKDVMTSEVITVFEHDTMSKVEELLKENHINHIPVIDFNNNILGILTKNDVQLMKNWGTPFNLDSSIKANKLLLNSQTASDRMNSQVITVTPEDTLENCALILRENYFHALPVTVGDKLVGIVTTMDLLKIAYGV
jgi:acetoin utilization protein AcuB